MGTNCTVNGYPLAPGNISNHRITRKRFATFPIAHKHIFYSFYQDPGFWLGAADTFLKLMNNTLSLFFVSLEIRNKTSDYL